ncbi:hypothetical protein [Minwuia thermotolerans]|uniref:Quinol:cytochrome C oxidoreductase n=1 Tax=Minwuia thermotolerans TaxID=2056226 RepID=A0A2M9G301_9PROT|nr:hypothetical protein [Minwuia thermotolerans]PJK30107.1 hypothetical protein CVT23_10140 [Minwuia thermotolerans]
MTGSGARYLFAFGAASGAVLCIVGALTDLGGLMQALAAAGLFWLALPLGAMAICIAHGLTGGAWGRATDVPVRALLATLPAALLPFAVILAAGPEHVFAWIDPPADLRHHLADKRFYLDQGFLTARFVLHAVIWIGLAWALGAWRTGFRPDRGLAAAGAVLWALSVTFFSFDWVMSLDPHWYSDVLGVVCMAAFTAPAMAAALLLSLLGETPMDRGVRDFATLLLGVLLIWVFTSFVQFLIIWMANLPHEIGWYLDRAAGGWRVVTVAMTALFFAVPVLLLAMPAGRQSRRAVRLAAGAVLFGHLLQSLWLVLPSLHHKGPALFWQTPAALLTVGGLAGLSGSLHYRRNAGGGGAE